MNDGGARGAHMGGRGSRVGGDVHFAAAVAAAVLDAAAAAETRLPLGHLAFWE